MNNNMVVSFVNENRALMLEKATRACNVEYCNTETSTDLLAIPSFLVIFEPNLQIGRASCRERV